MKLEKIGEIIVSKEKDGENKLDAPSSDRFVFFFYTGVNSLHTDAHVLLSSDIFPPSRPASHRNSSKAVSSGGRFNEQDDSCWPLVPH